MSKVSVIVAIYNVEKYLDKCLNSLHKQTYQDVEFLCINDGTKDNSQAIVDKYVKLDSRFKSYIKENGGLSDVRNYGINVASGEYIMFVDGDDFVEEKFVEAAVFYAESFKLDIFVFNYRQLYLHNNTSEVMNMLIKNGIYNIKEKPELLAYTPNCSWNKIYRKDLFINNNITYPKGLHHEDLATTFRLMYYAKKIGYENRILYNYIVDRPDNITTSVNKSIYNIIDVCEILLNFYKDKGEFNNYYDELNYLVERNYLQALRKIVRCQDKEFGDKFIDAIFKSKGQYFKRKNKKYKIAEAKNDAIYLHKSMLKLYYHHKLKGVKNA